MQKLSNLTLALLLSACANGQSAPETSKALHIGPGVTPPRILRKVEPEYSPLARADRVQGTVVFELVVNERGVAQDIEIISPLGFGLDERAEAAIRKWRFTPGTKDGKPVPVIARIEVNFRFPRTWFDDKAEQRRTAFNLALKTLDGDGDAAAQDRAIKTMQDLASQQFPPAMFLAGVWRRDAKYNLPRDDMEGWRLIQRAADKRYGPALYEIAIRLLKAGGEPEEMEKQRQTLRDAAVLGSVQAQFYLGQAYERGIGVPQEQDRARRYFRLCATNGEPVCEFRLGRLLLGKPDRSDDDYVQALAWLQLAAEQKVDEARAILNREQPQLSAAQAELVRKWNEQLSRK